MQDRAQPALAGWGGRGDRTADGILVPSRAGLPHDQSVVSVRITVEKASSEETDFIIHIGH